MNCLCPVLADLGHTLCVTPKVHEEIASKPAKSKRFALESMRISKLLDAGYLRVCEVDGHLRDQILGASNRVYGIGGKKMKIIHAAEAEALALASSEGAQAVLIDERITRMLVENPDGLRQLLSARNKAEVRMGSHHLRELGRLLSDVPIIRSADIVAIAYEKGILSKMHSVEDKSVLEAALSALKFSGCAISWDEIGQYKQAVI